jgi:hypothetical protein
LLGKNSGLGSFRLKVDGLDEFVSGFGFFE